MGVLAEMFIYIFKFYFQYPFIFVQKSLEIRLILEIRTDFYLRFTLLNSGHYKKIPV